MTLLAPVGGSFRDPRARVYDLDGEILRALDHRGAEEHAALERAPFFARAMADRRVISTAPADRDRPGAAALYAEGWPSVLAHERIPLVTHPYEWSFSMLRDAALLQLDLVQDALDDGFASKDGSSFNVQFVGSRPIFIDVGSFAPMTSDPWPGYRQFCALFLYPLLIEAYLGVSFAPLLRGSLDGITPEVATRLLRGRARWRRGVLSHVTLQAAAARRYAERDDPAVGVVRAGADRVEITRALVARTRRLVAGLPVPSGASEWSGYSERGHYEDAGLAAKDDFVRAALAACDPAVVVDLGCNDGRYAEMAAERARLVLAVDADRQVVDRLYHRLRGRGRPIVPMVADLADPSPALGWQLAERAPLWERVAPDLVLSLALIHHLVIGRNIPLGSYLDALHRVAPRLVLEVPHRNDPMVRRLLAAKPPHVDDDYHLEVIRAEIGERFEIRRALTLPGGTRTIYDLDRRG